MGTRPALVWGAAWDGYPTQVYVTRVAADGTPEAPETIIMIAGLFTFWREHKNLRAVRST